MTRAQRILKQWRDDHASARRAYQAARQSLDRPQAMAALRRMAHCEEAIRRLTSAHVRGRKIEGAEPTPIEAWCAQGGL